MTVYFVNKTGKTVIIELGSNKIQLNDCEKITVDSETDEIQFSCYLDEISTFKYLPLSKAVIIEYNFILNSLYDLTFHTDIGEVNFVQKQVKGNNLDWYKFVDLQLSNGNIKSQNFFVQDELLVKKQLSAVQKKEHKLEKRFRVIDILQSICYIGIPALIILFGIWYFVDLKTALYVLIPLTVIGVIVGLLIKNIINKVNDKLDKINSKFDKKSDKYVDINSFFDKSYIYSVLNNKNAIDK